MVFLVLSIKQAISRMTKERFIELITKELIGEISSDEAFELNTCIRNEPEFAHQRDLLKMYWESGNIDKSDDASLFQKVTQRIQAEDQEFKVSKSIIPRRNLLGLYGRQLLYCCFLFAELIIRAGIKFNI